MTQPCPFCGSERQELVSRDGEHWVRCLGCRAQGPPAAGIHTAIRLWDRWVSRWVVAAPTAATGG